jgi:hypothetical protein
LSNFGLSNFGFSEFVSFDSEFVFSTFGSFDLLPLFGFNFGLFNSDRPTLAPLTLIRPILACPRVFPLNCALSYSLLDINGSLFAAKKDPDQIIVPCEHPFSLKKVFRHFLRSALLDYPILACSSLACLTLVRSTLVFSESALSHLTLLPTVARPSLTRPTLACPTLARPTLARPTLARPTLARPTLARPTWIIKLWLF